MKKLIFFDIDGTLVTDNGTERIIPDSSFRAVQALQEAGHLCFINSGRTMVEIDSDILKFSMDGYICGCGTNITYHGKTLFAHTIPEELGNRILQDLESCHLEWLLEGNNSLYYSTLPYSTHIGDFLEEHRRKYSSLGFNRILPSEAKNLRFDKFCACTRKDSNLSQFMDIYKEDLDFIDRGEGFYEIVPLGCSKASGIQFLMDYFNILHEDTIAIGDSPNDLPMLKYAAVSIAMGGSTKAVCDASTFVTEPILDDGLWKAFHRLELI